MTNVKFQHFPRRASPNGQKKHSQASRPKKNPNRKIAYFAGCTANYLIPDVAKAVIEVFRINGSVVYFPEQKCCGIPSMLEGDRQLTLEFVQPNIFRLAGENIAGGDRRFQGTLGTQAVKIFDLVTAGTGLRDTTALEYGFDPLTVETETWDHKVYYPGA